LGANHDAGAYLLFARDGYNIRERAWGNFIATPHPGLIGEVGAIPRIIIE
jgi:hypothetical protein